MRLSKSKSNTSSTELETEETLLGGASSLSRFSAQNESGVSGMSKSKTSSTEELEDTDERTEAGPFEGSQSNSMSWDGRRDFSLLGLERASTCDSTRPKLSSSSNHSSISAIRGIPVPYELF